MTRTSWLFRAYVCATVLGIFSAFIFLTWLYAIVVSTLLTGMLGIATLVRGACQVSAIQAEEQRIVA